MEGWEKELVHNKRRAIIQITAEYIVLERGWVFKTFEYSITEIRQKTRMIMYGINGSLKVEALFKTMRKGVFKYEIYTTPIHELRDLAKLKRVAKL